MFGTKKQESQLASGVGNRLGGTSYSVIQDPRDGEVKIWMNDVGDPPNPWIRISSRLKSLSVTQRLLSRIENNRQKEED